MSNCCRKSSCVISSAGLETPWRKRQEDQLEEPLGSPLTSTYHSRIRDESANGSEIRIHRVHKLVHRLGVRRVDLVRLGLDIEFLGNLLSDFGRFFAAVVDNGDVAARLGDLSGNRESDSSVAACDNDRLEGCRGVSGNALWINDRRCAPFRSSQCSNQFRPFLL